MQRKMMTTTPLAAGMAIGGLTAGAWTIVHRRAAAVRNWRPSEFGGEMKGELYARVGEADGDPTVLLHGLVSTGDVFGADFDSLRGDGPLIVPDLLGFGRSLDESRGDFGPEAHLDALDELMDGLGLGGCNFQIGAHSMGSALAMRWAARHPDRVRRIACWGAPVYRDEAAARATITGSGLMTRLFVLDTQWAQKACAMSCRHRVLGGWATALSEPTLPLRISRAVPLHTWPAYRDGMVGLVLETDWCDLLPAAAERADVTLTWGANDPVGDKGFAEELLGHEVNIIPDADHHLPMTHGARCREDLDRGGGSGSNDGMTAWRAGT